MLPTLEHELVDSGWAVHRSRKPEGLVDSLHDLRRRPGQSLDLKHIYGPERVLCSHVDIKSSFEEDGGKLRWTSGNFLSPPPQHRLSVVIHIKV